MRRTRATISEAEAPATTGRFGGKVALITGASDRGIGGAIAERLAGEGASVVVASRQEPDRLIKRIERHRQGVVWTHCDVTAGDDVRHAIDQCMENFGQIDVVVNNAGVEFNAPLESVEEHAWRDLLEVNLGGAVRVSQAVLAFLLSPGGVIVNISSALAQGGCPGFSVYSASKAGLDGFTQSLAWELAPRGIRVVGVAPALVYTPMVAKHVRSLTEATRERIEACHPLGVGAPQDVAAAVAFLASEEARWITGVTLPLGWAPHFPLPAPARES
jgi:NAD(P)-dependent dehydrogenase (short-subunit alcohol dehydrogenase family)